MGTGYEKGIFNFTILIPDAVKVKKWVPRYRIHSQNDYSSNTTLASKALGLKEVKDYCILHPVLNIYELQRHLEKKGSQRKQKCIQSPKQAKQSLYKGKNP